MSQLDEALTEMRLDLNDAKRQSKYYDLFLNANFYVPTLENEQAPDGVSTDAAVQGETKDQVLPLVIESQGNDYLMLFDSVERLHAWAQAEVPCVEVPGHVLAATSMPPLHWALNVGTEHSKQFLPDEIAWLKDVVEQCNAEAAKQQEA